ncbi:MAG: hypothetical protein PHR83_01965 [Paludibacter sp.]|nr:hypothetical protein [Paludibacter sp.]
MIMVEYWEIYEGLDGNVIFSVKGLDQDDLFLIMGLISRYLSLFDEEFNGNFNIEFYSVITDPNAPICNEFYTSLPYSLYELYNDMNEFGIGIK